jgi:hypothetical protein
MYSSYCAKVIQSTHTLPGSPCQGRAQRTTKHLAIQTCVARETCGSHLLEDVRSQANERPVNREVRVVSRVRRLNLHLHLEATCNPRV